MDVKNKQKKKNNTESWNTNMFIGMHIVEIVLIIVFILVALIFGHYKYAFYGLLIVLLYLTPAILYYMAMKIYPFIKRFFKKKQKIMKNISNKLIITVVYFGIGFLFAGGQFLNEMKTYKCVDKNAPHGYVTIFNNSFFKPMENCKRRVVHNSLQTPQH